MQRLRFILASLATIVTLGSLAISGGYGWYLRSGAYRAACAEALSERLGLPAEIGRVTPRSRHSRQFHDVVVWLPERRGQALYCREAWVVGRPEEDDPEAYEIKLVGGACEISKRTWLQPDYREVLAAGLRPGFSADGPRRVLFSRMDVSFALESFRAELAGASGRISFENPELGRANLFCQTFNGYQAPERVHLDVTFRPRSSGIRVERAELTVPALPLRTLNLRELTGADIRSGSFSGRLIYAENGQRETLTVSGKCFGVELSECTAALLARPWRGRCPELELIELRVENGRPNRLRFRGVLTDVVLGDLLAPLGFDGVGGDLTLRIGDAVLSEKGIDRLVASGRCLNLSLEGFTSALGRGAMTGNLRMVIDDLTIEDNQLVSLEAKLVVDEASDPPNWVAGALLRELVKQVLKLDLPPILPERIEYTRLGFRLDVRDEVLNVYGTHGQREKTILTVRLLDQDVPLISEPSRPIDLRPWLDALRLKAIDGLRRQLSPSTAPRDSPG